MIESYQNNSNSLVKIIMIYKQYLVMISCNKIPQKNISSNREDFQIILFQGLLYCQTRYHNNIILIYQSDHILCALFSLKSESWSSIHTQDIYYQLVWYQQYRLDSGEKFGNFTSEQREQTIEQGQAMRRHTFITCLGYLLTSIQDTYRDT